jgi:hypothetical protein
LQQVCEFRSHLQWTVEKGVGERRPWQEENGLGQRIGAVQHFADLGSAQEVESAMGRRRNGGEESD